MLNVFAIGNLTRDPEETENGCRFVMACNAPNDTVDYLTVYCSGKAAEAVLKYKHKGDKIAISGRMHCAIHETADNVYLNETVSASYVEFLNSRNESEGNENKKNQESEPSREEKRFTKRFSK